MSEQIETKRKSIIVDPRMPVVSIILMAIALLASVFSLIAFRSFAYLNFFSMLLIFVGMILHKKNLQILTGIGTLIIALTHLIYVIGCLVQYIIVHYTKIF